MRVKRKMENSSWSQSDYTFNKFWTFTLIDQYWKWTILSAFVEIDSRACLCVNGQYCLPLYKWTVLSRHQHKIIKPNFVIVCTRPLGDAVTSVPIHDAYTRNQRVDLTLETTFRPSFNSKFSGIQLRVFKTLGTV